MYDTIVQINNSTIQHGSQNKRIYLMHLATEDMPQILDVIHNMADKNFYTKIFAKVPEAFIPTFLENGYVMEAHVPFYFNATENCIFMAKYLDASRSISTTSELNKKVLESAIAKGTSMALETKVVLKKDFLFRKANTNDVFAMANLYSKVFDSYPFPIFEPEYIKQTMENNVIYFGIWKGNDLIALSSCEISLEDKNVEMTDFAVDPIYRGHKLALFLLTEMEKEMKKQEIKTAYTIARAVSYGMNATFAKCGYVFSGTLINNTQIGGKIEDMNVWFKSLQQ
ncbi:N-acetyltransferase YodP [Anaerotignum neopropionicum]|uniref:N-acetyltransferase YodP n=1 Tax=Anaerotignum neopropionicum TaxID=36847 RepID=A0A136WF34_9FIRM|nr:putative beta-lysine N-acetyltransferase [Anaerotignum neopropionicum]KXL53156.1 N-acetyltransferase YodP [Anaerotignum neopropionicum]